MYNKIKEDIVNAMKSKDTEVLSVLRMVKGAVQLIEIDKKREAKDDEVIAIISKQIKSRMEAIEQFKLGNRQDLIDQNNSEIDILKRYMPEQLSSEEVEKIVTDKISELNIESSKQIGQLMSGIMPLVKGKADMSEVNRVIKEKLANQ